MSTRNNEKYTNAQFLEAIKGSSGIKATIMSRLGCSRGTVDNYLNRYVTLQRAYDEEIEFVGDVAESVIIRDIRNGSVETSKWYAREKLKHRGYGTDKSKHEHTIKDVRQLSDDELRAIVDATSGS